MRIATLLVILGLIAFSTSIAEIARAGDDPKSPGAGVPRSEDPVYLFLNTPGDLETFWKLIRQPDRVVLDGAQYRRLLQGTETSKRSESRSAAVVDVLTATGQVVGDWVNLSIDYQVVLDREAAEWVSLKLDGLTLSSVRDGETDLPTRMVVEDRGWQVELKGKGTHVVRVSLIAPVRSTVEGKRIELAIPPVASTGIDIEVPRMVLDASTALQEKMTITPSDRAPGSTRLQARLSPRSKLEVDWRERADPAVKLPPLLEAQGDIAVEIDRDSILTRSTWNVGSIRGTVGQINLRLDVAEEVLDVLVDGKPVLVESRREGARSVVTIPLSELLRPGTSRAVTVSTRRQLASQGAIRATIEGYSFDQAKVQSGMIAISRSGPLFLNPISTRGLRRIDPRTELPDSLRTRADTVLAFGFNGPPFELVLRIEPAPPRLQVEERTTITVDPRLARIQTRLDCRTSQGKVYEIQVLLPKGLDFEPPEPSEFVGPSQVIPLDRGATLGVGIEVPRLLSISLTPQAREGEPFFIVLKGWCAIDPSKPIDLPLFRPVTDSSRGGRVAIVTDRNVSVELATTGDDSTGFRVDWGQPPLDWTWPNRKPAIDQGLLWLRTDSNPETLPLKATVRPRSIRHQTTLNATIDRRGAEVVEEISGEVAFGSLAKLDLSVPREVGDRWEIEGVERTIREPMEVEPDGSRRYRVRFPRDDNDTFRLRIRYRLPFSKANLSEPGGKLLLAPIRVLEGTSSGRRIFIGAESGLEVQAEGKGWATSPVIDPAGSSDSGPPIRIGLIRQAEDAGAVMVTVNPASKLPMPLLVASRLWVKAEQQPDNDLMLSAYYWIETHEATMTIGLDPGTTFVRARIGPNVLGEGSVDPIKPDEYRIKFPNSTPSGPILLAIETFVPASIATKGWNAPKLIGGVVQQTVWEAQLLGNRAGVGTPPGWLDENEWSWDGWIWQRKPRKNPLELANWLTGGNTRGRPGETIDLGERGNRHSYLFSRVGPSTPLRFVVYSRFTLLLLCSGPVLGAGLLVLARRPPARWTAASLLIVGFAVAAVSDRDVLILVVQSSLLGVVLFLVSLLIHWTIERRNQTRPPGDFGMIAPVPTVGSTFQRAPLPGVGSDDSTAIRVRPVTPSAVSTADHIILTRAIARDHDGQSGPGSEIR